MLPQLLGCSGELDKPNALIAIFLKLPDTVTLEEYVRHLSTHVAYVGTLLDVGNERANIDDVALVNEDAAPRLIPTLRAIYR